MAVTVGKASPKKKQKRVRHRHSADGASCSQHVSTLEHTSPAPPVVAASARAEQTSFSMAPTPRVEVQTVSTVHTVDGGGRRPDLNLHLTPRCLFTIAMERHAPGAVWLDAPPPPPPPLPPPRSPAPSAPPLLLLPPTLPPLVAFPPQAAPTDALQLPSSSALSRSGSPPPAADSPQPSPRAASPPPAADSPQPSPPPATRHAALGASAILAGALDADHCVPCDCSCGGVADESRQRAAPPRTRGARAVRPTPDLESLLYPPGTVSDARIDTAMAAIAAQPFDRQMVLEGGCGPDLVNLLDTGYPTCRRRQYSTCRHRRLARYGAHLQPFESCAMRAMLPAVYELGVDTWRALWHRLPEACRSAPPDWCSAQTYEAWRGDFMDYHTDLRPSYEGCTCACPADSCVITVSVGATMNFWHREIINGDVSNLGEQRAVPLTDRSVWLWLPQDDRVNSTRS